MSTHTRPDPPATLVIRPHFPRLADPALVPLLTAEQYHLLGALLLAPQPLTDWEFRAANHLIAEGLAVLDRRTDRITITDAGREYLAAGP